MQPEYENNHHDDDPIIEEVHTDNEPMPGKALLEKAEAAAIVGQLWFRLCGMQMHRPSGRSPCQKQRSTTIY